MNLLNISNLTFPGYTKVHDDEDTFHIPTQLIANILGSWNHNLLVREDFLYRGEDEE
jgi:hypothetical protein